MPDLTETSTDHRFPCTTCGADLRFDPTTEGLTCHHCGAQQEIESGRSTPIEEKNFHAGLKKELAATQTSNGALDLQGEELRTSSCDSCGARVSFSDTVHAKECPYCATPVVVDTGSHRQLKPQAVLPFELSEKQAHQAMSDWLGSLWFAPNALKKYARKGRRLSGIYVPFWTFDAQTDTRYTGQRGDDYYVTVKRGDETVRERRTRWSRARGHVSRWFDDVLIVASTALPLRYIRSLSPWHLSALEPYLPDYLAGFRSEAYNVSLDDGFDEAQEEMAKVIRRDIKFDIGGDRQRIQSMDTKCTDITYKHVLLPVWTAAYKFRGKTYRFVVNGQTGKVQGERPYSKLKIALAILAGLMVAAALGYAYALNEGQVPLPYGAQ